MLPTAWVSADVAQWLTATIVPWWATVTLPIATLIVSQHFSNKAAEKQRTAEAADREKERTHNLATTKEQLLGDRTRAAEERSAVSQQARKDRIAESFASALDAIAHLRSDLARSALEKPYLEEQDGKWVPVAEVTHAPLDASAVTAFLAGTGKIRLYVSDDLDVDDVATAVIHYMTAWPNILAEQRPTEVSLLDEKLRGLASNVSEIYRVRAGLA